MKIFIFLLSLGSLGYSGQVTTLSFVGDVNFTSHIADGIEKNGIKWPFEKVRDILRSSDFTVANLESPAGTGGEKYCKKLVYFRADPKYLDALNDAGIDLVSLANNHALDYGPDVLNQTMEELTKRHIQYMGIVKDSSHENEPVVVNINDLKIGFLAYCNACPNEFSPGKDRIGVSVGYSFAVIDQIKKLRPLVDFIIVFPHWGSEYYGVDNNQWRLMDKIANAGADLIVGAHPHVLQKISTFIMGPDKNFVVAYSLGNFLFPMGWYIAHDSAILNIHLEKGKMITYDFVPVSLNTNRPVPARQDTEQFKRIKYILERGYEFNENRHLPTADDVRKFHDSPEGWTHDARLR